MLCNVLFPAANESLERLDLSWNNIRKRGAVELAHGVKVSVLTSFNDLSKTTYENWTNKWYI